MQNIAENYSMKYPDVKKVVPNLDKKKTNYTACCMNLQLYLSLGIHLIKIHKILKFNNLSGWQNILSLRKKKDAKREFEKKFIKTNE